MSQLELARELVRRTLATDSNQSVRGAALSALDELIEVENMVAIRPNKTVLDDFDALKSELEKSA